MPSHILALFLVGSAADPTPASVTTSPRHYVLVFGGNRDRLLPRTGHTWATFVRASTQPDGATHLDVVTISWMPASLNVRPFAIRAEPGKNLTLPETIAWISGPRTKASVWGPYETRPEIFQQAQHRAAFLESGQVKYRVFDRFDRLPDIEHCIHAVTRVDPRWERAAQPVQGNSEHGTGHVVNALLRTGTATLPARPADWILPALELDKTNFTHRD